MPSRYPEFDLKCIRTFPMEDRESKVSLANLGRPAPVRDGIAEFIESLPAVLGAQSLREVIAALHGARKNGRAIVLATGAHTIKIGLAPILIDLMRHGYITAIALNGAGVIHDLEMARYGATSEDVVVGLKDGRFGMAEEANAEINAIARRAADTGQGYGETVGEALQDAPNADISIFANAWRLGIPATVHVAVGTDIHTMRADADGAALGAASLRDFRILTEHMRNLNHGGVLMNVGSAVVLPEVLLKAMAILRNTTELTDFTGVNLDFMQQYRSGTQVVYRVKEMGGRGYALTGHNEIMVPLIAWALRAIEPED
jgi:deoxyhypusine synthase